MGLGCIGNFKGAERCLTSAGFAALHVLFVKLGLLAQMSMRFYGLNFIIQRRTYVVYPSAVVCPTIKSEDISPSRAVDAKTANIARATCSLFFKIFKKRILKFPKNLKLSSDMDNIEIYKHCKILT
jgi:hypothetical protein